MKSLLPAVILAISVVIAGYVAGNRSEPTYAVVNSGTEYHAAFYRINVRTGAVQLFVLDATGWRCGHHTNEKTCTVELAQ